MPVACKVCEAANTEEMEAVGVLALADEISWAEVARRLELPHIKGIQNHMMRHYVPPPSEAELFEEAFDPLVGVSIEELGEAMKYAPPEVKPFYAIAIQNLKGLKDTKPSQQHLINALKAIHEVTGMKMEQQLMLQFAQHRFGLGSGAAKEAIEQHADVIDVEEIPE